MLVAAAAAMTAVIAPGGAQASQLQSFTEFHVVSPDSPPLDTGFSLKPRAPITVVAFGTGLMIRVGDGPWTQAGSGPTQVSGTGELDFAVSEDAPGAVVALFSYDCYPGNGIGDANHYRCGPPGRR